MKTLNLQPTNPKYHEPYLPGPNAETPEIDMSNPKMCTLEIQHYTMMWAEVGLNDFRTTSSRGSATNLRLVRLLVWLFVLYSLPKSTACAKQLRKSICQLIEALRGANSSWGPGRVLERWAYAQPWSNSIAKQQHEISDAKTICL